MFRALNKRHPIWRVALAWLALVLGTACGPTDVRTGLPPSRASLPKDLSSPPLISAVPLGSRDVTTNVASGRQQGSVLLELLAEPGAKVLYALRANIAASEPESELMLYQSPLELKPPFELSAFAEKDGVRGPVRRFAYDLDPEVYTPAPAVSLRRLFGDGAAFSPYSTKLETTSLPALGAAERLAAAPVVDGALADWSGQGRLRARDGLFDVPAGKGYMDLAWSEVGETDDAIYVAWGTREAPRVAEGVVYGFEIGPSNIGLTSFGSGAEFRYRAEVENGRLRLFSPKSGEAVPLIGSSAVAISAVVELKLAKVDLGLLGGDEVELSARTFASERGPSYAISDRMQPVFMRSRFTLLRAASGEAGALVDLDFLQPAGGTLGDATLAPSYLALGEPLVRELEAANQIPFYERGSFPLFFVDKEENGYAGLNTTDRGMLTTLGPNTSLMSRVQLLGHELAHFQNARSSRVDARWLQEGMSEWSSERLLYRHFPRRAVHKYLRKVRFDRYFDTLAGGLDEFPLDTWGGEVARAGYEKSLMFFDLLEIVVGQEALVRAFQAGVNLEMGSVVFQRFLERETGRDLSSLFRYWIFAGEPAAEYDPRTVFGDEDGDDLTRLDETSIGTDPTKLDTDGDGDLDSEEFFRGKDPRVSDLDPSGDLRGRREPVLAANFAGSTDTSPLFRLAGDPAGAWSWSLDPFALAPETPYTVPQSLRPPFTVAVRGTLDGASSAISTATRGLFVNGLAVTTPAPTVAILPPVPLDAVVLAPSAKLLPSPTQTAAPDVAFDLPSELGAYDLASARFAEDDQAVELTWELRGAPDLYGVYGNYQAIFQTVSWVGGAPEIKRHHAFIMVAGEPFFSTLVGDTETAERLDHGVTVSYGEHTLGVRLDKSLLGSWLSASGQLQTCLATELSLEAKMQLTDRGPCLAPRGNTDRIEVDDAYGLGQHVVDLDATSVSAARRGGLLQLAATALVEFERVLARPLLERRHWPLRVELLDGGETQAAAHTSAGAYVSIDGNAGDATIDYLVVEQLARLVVADLLDKQGGAAYWVQESHIQWLTSTAMYRIYPSRDVHAFHAARFEDLKCYLGGDPDCASFFGQDVYLAAWEFATLDSTGSVKSLLFMLELDALVGTEALAKAMSLYANGVPTPERLLHVLQGFAPVRSAALTELFAAYVEGTGNLAADRARVLSALEDLDGDGLYVVEETKLGRSDASADPYLQ